MKVELKSSSYYLKNLGFVAMTLGVLFYVVWLVAFGLDKWNDMGVYSVTIFMVGIGFAAYFTYSAIEMEEQTAAQK